MWDIRDVSLHFLLVFFALMLLYETLTICTIRQELNPQKKSREENKKKKSLTILLDMDDTIEDLLTTWVCYLDNKYQLDVSPNDITDWDMMKFFPTLTKEEVFSPLGSPEFWGGVEPLDGAVGIIQKLQEEGHKVFIVTNSSFFTIGMKYENVLQKHFPFIPKENIIVCSKKEMVKGDVLVDDKFENLLHTDCKKILMNMPHNKKYNAATYGMTRVDDWYDIYKEIKKLTK